MVLFAAHKQRPHAQQRRLLTTRNWPHEGPLPGMNATAASNPKRTLAPTAARLRRHPRMGG